MMKKPKICAVITNNDIACIHEIKQLVDFFEVRIDMLGTRWEEVIPQLNKRWIACNRSLREGGQWEGDEAQRIAELLKASAMGAAIVDIELSTEGLHEAVRQIREKSRCLISFHAWKKTLPLERLEGIVRQQLHYGADICKVVTTARTFEDNTTMLNLIRKFPTVKVVAFAMGTLGITSRVLSPLAGGFLTYASVQNGHASAPGQLTVEELHNIYRTLTR